MTEVRTRDEAIAVVDAALQAWSTNVSGILSQAQNTAGAAKNEVERVVRKCANEVAAIEALLAAADAEEGRHLRAKLVRAREAHEQARRASIRVNDVVANVALLSRSHTTRTTAQVASARVQLSTMSRALEGYRSGRVGFGGGGPGGGRPAPASTFGTRGSPLSSMGLAELDVSAADLDETPILDDAGEKFGKGGLSRADYRWAVQTWNDTVGPGVSNGKTRDDFAERDARSVAAPLRRTADVYDIFLGTDRIHADRRPDGSLSIINGRHRLLIARELGIKRLPGQVS